MHFYTFYCSIPAKTIKSLKLLSMVQTVFIIPIDSVCRIELNCMHIKIVSVFPFDWNMTKV